MNLDDNSRVDESTPGNQTTSRLHPRVYGLITGLVAWLVVSVWIFAGTGPTDYLLAIVSGFIFIIMFKKRGRNHSP